MILKQEDLTSIIDTVKKSVDDSWVGQIDVYGGTPDKPTKSVNPIGLQIYLAVLVGVLKNMEKIESIEPSFESDLTNFNDDN